MILSERERGTADIIKVSQGNYHYGIWLPTPDSVGRIAVSEWENPEMASSRLLGPISLLAAVGHTGLGVVLGKLDLHASFGREGAVASGRATLPHVKHLQDRAVALQLADDQRLPAFEAFDGAGYSAKQGVEAAGRDTVLIAAVPGEHASHLVDDTLNHVPYRSVMPVRAREILAEHCNAALEGTMPPMEKAILVEDTPINRCMQAIDTQISGTSMGLALHAGGQAAIARNYEGFLGVTANDAWQLADGTLARYHGLNRLVAS
ncbi:MAG TPA: hypothetical protein VLH38_02020 [Patescibacteria group bacterium]|nr:hypothetical protein [Patescibacteria group bacterium]